MTMTAPRLAVPALPDVPAGFGYTEDHELARKTAQRFFAERCPMTEVRRLASDERGFDPALWREMAGMGWLGLTLPEADGGAAQDHLHLGLLFEELGRALVPSPFFGAWLASTALQLAGSSEQRARWLPSILSGETLATLALPQATPSSAGAVATRSELRGGDVVLSGRATHVVSGSDARLLVVPAQEPSGALALYVVELPSAQVTVAAELGLDVTRRSARITLDGAVVPSSARLEGDALAALRTLHVRACALLACEMSGGMERVLGLVRDYAKERTQFGKPIGAFQAVSHAIVNVMIGAELSRSLALGAALALDGHDPRATERAARMAKAYASDAYLLAVQKGVQLHGGFGFTWDCDVHFYFKRALWSRGTLGDAVHHRRWLARELLGSAE